MYKLNKEYIIRLADGAAIPQDVGNSDYVAYLAWISAGNTPEPEFSLEELALTLSVTARLSRDAELARADIQLLKVQDGVTGIGTQKAWREYRNALREWPSTENFPEVMPVAPDAK